MLAEYVGALVMSLCAVLLAYHHALYPFLLKYLASRKTLKQPQILKRGWRNEAVEAQELPFIQIVMPAYNEARYIAEKLRNLAALDYPEERWQLLLLLDGCKDNTAQIAREVLAEPEVRGMSVELLDHAENRGKIHRLNQAMGTAKAPLVLFSDVSALLPVDSLLALAAHFNDPHVGAVSLGYRLLQPASEGEAGYWQYQSAIKTCESQLGCVQGAHGSAWAMRRSLFQVLPSDTINDDFILPMQIAQQGYRVVYESRLHALELECIDPAVEHSRRRRIGAGNAQQAWRLRQLLAPKQGLLAFMFASGKVLRVLMPFCLLLLLITPMVLAPLNHWYALFFLLQLSGYGLFFGMHLLGIRPMFRPLRLAHYLLAGHWANFVGCVRYLCGLQQGVWQRAGEKPL